MSDDSAGQRPPLLLADIGGTNARFAVVDADGAEQTVVLRCADHRSLEAAIRAALVALGTRPWPESAALAVAAPVLGDEVALTNLSWRFSVGALRAALGLRRLEVINDFTALALGIPGLGAADRRQIGPGVPVAGAPIAVLGPGSGLGVSGLVPAGDGGWIALSGEGGHITMAPADDTEGAVLAALRRRTGHISAEDVLSGPGLAALYQTLCDIAGRAPERLDAAGITAAALTGDCPLCTGTVELFAAFLGTVAGNLALTLGARGGVYIGGGIVPRLGALFGRSAFRRRFTGKGAHAAAYLAPIPTYVITHPLPAFPGLRALLSAGARS